MNAELLDIEDGAVNFLFNMSMLFRAHKNIPLFKSRRLSATQRYKKRGEPSF
jgi:hypothetical protein